MPTLQDELVEAQSQGKFVLEGINDILALALGKPEHLGRVRGKGFGVGIKAKFNSSNKLKDEKIRKLEAI